MAFRVQDDNCAISCVNQWSLVPVRMPTGISNLGCSGERQFCTNSSAAKQHECGNGTAVRLVPGPGSRAPQPCSAMVRGPQCFSSATETLCLRWEEKVHSPSHRGTGLCGWEPRPLVPYLESKIPIFPPLSSSTQHSLPTHNVCAHGPCIYVLN